MTWLGQPVACVLATSKSAARAAAAAVGVEYGEELPFILSVEEAVAQGVPVAVSACQAPLLAGCQGCQGCQASTRPSLVGRTGPR